METDLYGKAACTIETFSARDVGFQDVFLIVCEMD